MKRTMLKRATEVILIGNMKRFAIWNYGKKRLEKMGITKQLLQNKAMKILLI